MEDVAAQAKEKKQNNSLLMLACARGYTADTKKLLEMGADVAARDKKGVTPLHFAAGQGRLEIVQFLWSKAAELEAEDPAGRMPLHMAANGGHPETVAFLLDKGVWADAYDSQDDTALHMAARKADLQCVKVLLKFKVQTSARNKRALTPLGEAIVGGHLAVVTHLVENGCNPREKQKGWSLLHLAAALGHRDCLAFLLKHGCDVHDADNSDGYTALHCAALGGHAGCVDALLAAQADTAAVSSADRLAVELLPAKSSKDLKKKLTPNGPRKAKPASAHKADDPASAQPQQHPGEAFKALSREAQRAQVLRWKEMNAADRPKALIGFPAEVESRLKEVVMVQQMITIQQAIERLHEDEDFQQDAKDPSIEPALDIMRADPQAMERYEGDARLMRVLHKLRSFQSVITANGRHKVPFPELVIEGKPNWRDLDVRRAQGMAGMLAAQINASCAAACASSEQEAKAAAAKAAEPPAPAAIPAPDRQPPAARSPDQSLPAHSQAGPSTATSSPAVTTNFGKPQTQAEGTKKAAAQDSKQTTGSKSSSSQAKKAGKQQAKHEPVGRIATGAAGTSTAATATSSGDDDPDRLPSWSEIFTWEKFMKELKRQLYQSVLLVAALLIFMWWQGMPLPWQEGHPGMAAMLGWARPNHTLVPPAEVPSMPGTADSVPDPASFWDSAEGA